MQPCEGETVSVLPFLTFLTLFIADYSCNLSRNNRSLFGAKVGINAASTLQTMLGCIRLLWANQRSSHRPYSSLAASSNWPPSAWMRPNMKILNLYNKCHIYLAQ